MKKLTYFLSLKEALKEFKKRPAPVYLWGGIKEKTFGLVFGISKSGKTIFCENFALALSIGSPEYFGKKLSGVPTKVLFVGLEEFWVSRMERNQKQLGSLSLKQQKLAEENYLVQPFDFTKHLISGKHWGDLIKMIVKSEAKVVFIDSITRMNHGNLEDSKTAEEIMQKLRNICHDNRITLVCIHHTPKMIDQPLGLDKIKGSAVFGQEADFALGISRTSKGHRYQKDVFYRYAPDDVDVVREFTIDENIRIIYVGETYEGEILNRSDGRRNEEHRNKILSYFKEHACKEHQTSELLDVFKSLLSLKERQIKQLLSELVKEDEISRPKNGYYKSNDCIGKEESNEEE